MSWDEAFASRYEDWSAQMTADVGFYVELARQADGPLVELGIGNGRVAARLDGEHRSEPPPHTIRHWVGDNRIDIVLEDGARSSLWWATRNEWLRLLDVAGLELEALYGGFAGEPFADDSREYVFVARR